MIQVRRASGTDLCELAFLTILEIRIKKVQVGAKGSMEKGGGRHWVLYCKAKFMHKYKEERSQNIMNLGLQTDSKKTILRIRDMLTTKRRVRLMGIWAVITKIVIRKKNKSFHHVSYDNPIAFLTKFKVEAVIQSGWGVGTSGAEILRVAAGILWPNKQMRFAPSPKSVNVHSEKILKLYITKNKERITRSTG